ncbi:MAG TPA: ferritin-like domain-containing protein [Sphingomonas sp.]|uniref:ferritin-like domain-containing protein n=1 Tax=Sphingomonas sp. TaxID=28214 RepID=UPI002D06596D|nr:ferritin-like domain-containing protein [Sphingomonas sp.]HMI19298.1 ferritin-like domain-containing protein [Sphingomonas sp.]
MGVQSLHDNPPRKSAATATKGTGPFADLVGIVLRPLHRLIWANPERRARKLLQFAEVEAAGGRDLVRAAELTADPVLRDRYLRHARDEARHADMFQAQGRKLHGKLHEGDANGALGEWIAPGERGIDGLDVARESDATLLAFLHLSESAAARDFARYAHVIDDDAATRTLFQRILRDEDQHKKYTRDELFRIAPRRSRRVLWWARLRRLWKAYLRFATAFAGVIAGVVLTLQYFLLLPPFAWLAKRAARRERTGWISVDERARR